MSVVRPEPRGNVSVGVLSITAVILLVAVVVVRWTPVPSRADGMSVAGGDYIMTVGALADTDEDYVYIIDVPSSKLAVYRFDTQRKRIQIVQGVELARLRTPTGTPQPLGDNAADAPDDNDLPQPQP